MGDGTVCLPTFIKNSCIPCLQNVYGIVMGLDEIVMASSFSYALVFNHKSIFFFLFFFFETKNPVKT